VLDEGLPLLGYRREEAGVAGKVAVFQQQARLLFFIEIPDMKYGSSEVARRLSHVTGYVEVNRRAVKEMHRQVGDLVLGEDGVALRGLLVRHLVLPGGLAGTEEVLAFLAELSPDTYLNLMTQYRPCYRASELPPLDRRPTAGELRRAFAIADRLGLKRLSG